MRALEMPWRRVSLSAPLVTCIAGSIPEVVGNHAWLVPPDDALALRNVINDVLINPEASQQKARDGRVYVRERYHWQMVARRFVAVYEGCIPA